MESGEDSHRSSEVFMFHVDRLNTDRDWGAVI